MKWKTRRFRKKCFCFKSHQCSRKINFICQYRMSQYIGDIWPNWWWCSTWRKWRLVIKETLGGHREIHVQKKYFNEQHKNWRFFSKWMDRFSNRHKCNLIPTVYPRHVDGQPVIIIIYQKHLILYTFVCH
jgi:hypothetical protein